ncbi:hypothetical protein scyTo_0008612 [Scyliorhinus torazame]|uniref:Immunoglobulin V-set domain-containing protein n=1 Tax=Scyliorhinus torazame TaxID=75743 RepID=A0A401PBQ7_SCYTO|nr:hypothetical protein [Scyliorhinus torazame]
MVFTTLLFLTLISASPTQAAPIVMKAALGETITVECPQAESSLFNQRGSAEDMDYIPLAALWGSGCLLHFSHMLCTFCKRASSAGQQMMGSVATSAREHQWDESCIRRPARRLTNSYTNEEVNDSAQIFDRYRDTCTESCGTMIFTALLFLTLISTSQTQTAPIVMTAAVGETITVECPQAEREDQLKIWTIFRWLLFGALAVCSASVTCYAHFAKGPVMQASKLWVLWKRQPENTNGMRAAFKDQPEG